MRSTTMNHRFRLASLGVIAAVVLLAFAPVAGAHGGAGRLEVVSVTPTGTGAVVTVRLTFVNDGEPVDTATVTVAGDDGSGRRLDPVPLTRTEQAGEYSGAVELPSAGTWNLRVTSVTPPATLTLTQQVAGDDGVDASTSTTVDGSAPPRPGDSGVVAPAPTSTATPITDPAATDPGSTDSGSGGGSGAAPWIAGGVALAVVVGLGLFLSRQRGKQSTDDGAGG